MDPEADNYNPDATIDDGCVYNVVGCVTTTAHGDGTSYSWGCKDCNGCIEPSIWGGYEMLGEPPYFTKDCCAAAYGGQPYDYITEPNQDCDSHNNPTVYSGFYCRYIHTKEPCPPHLDCPTGQIWDEVSCSCISPFESSGRQPSTTSQCNDPNAFNYNPYAKGCSSNSMDYSCCEYYIGNVRDV